MKEGVPTDYKLKESLIINQKEELDIIVTSFNKLGESSSQTDE